VLYAVLALTLSSLTLLAQAEPDSYSKPVTTYHTTTLTKGGESQASYWTTGSGVAVFLVLIPLCLIPLILLGLKLAEKSGLTPYSHPHVDGHFDGHLYKRAFTFSPNARAMLGDLTKKVFQAIKVSRKSQ